MKTVYVLCLNDFPEAVFERKDRALDFRDRYSMPNEGRYWHVREVPMEPSREHMDASVKQRRLLEKR